MIKPNGTFKYPMMASQYKGASGYNLAERIKEVSTQKPISITYGNNIKLTLVEVMPSSEFHYKHSFCFYNKEGFKIQLIEKESNDFGARWKANFTDYRGTYVGYIDELTIDIELDKIMRMPFNGRLYKCLDCETENRSFYTK